MVTISYTCIQTIVETHQHWMSRIPCIKVKCRNTWVTPCTDGLISWQFSCIPQLTHKTRSTTIQTIDIAVTICTRVTCQCHIGIALGIKCSLINLHDSTWVNWGHIQILGARTHTQSKQYYCCRDYFFKIS